MRCARACCAAHPVGDWEELEIPPRPFSPVLGAWLSTWEKETRRDDGPAKSALHGAEANARRGITRQKTKKEAVVMCARAVSRTINRK